MKRALKIALRSLYILPALGVLFGGDVLSHEVAPGGEGLFGPKKAEADAPYSQGSYYSQGAYYSQGYYEGSYQSYYESSYDGPSYGDCPGSPSPSPDSPDSPGPGPDGCC